MVILSISFRSMNLLRQSFSILLAILMANPGCCCTLKKVFHSTTSEEVTSKVVPSCCSAPRPPDESEPEPSDCPNCPCEKLTSFHEFESAFQIGSDYSSELIQPDPEHLVAHFPTLRPPQNAPPANESPPPLLWLLFESFLL